MATHAIHYVSVNNDIVSYPPLCLHSAHHITMGTIPSTAVLLFQTEHVPRRMGAQFQLTDEITCLENGALTKVPCSAFFILEEELSGHHHELPVDVLREVLLHALEVYDRGEITKEEFTFVHRQFQDNFMYPILIVRIARVVDNALWPKLFSATPSPHELFTAAMKMGFETEAAAFIRVIDVMMGREEALLSTLQLLDNVDVRLIHDIIHALFHDRELDNPTPVERTISGNIQKYITGQLAYHLKEGNLQETFAIICDQHPFILMCLEHVENKETDIDACRQSAKRLASEQTTQACYSFGRTLLSYGFLTHALMVGVATQIKNLLVFDASEQVFDKVIEHYQFVETLGQALTT